MATRISSVLEDYLGLEQSADIRYELLDGRIVAMAGGSANHDRLIRNLTVCVADCLGDGPCDFHTSNMRVKAGELRCYPDLSVACGEAEYIPEAGQTLTNPVALFEVLSASTERDDRGIKFRAYEQIPTLTDYVLISQDRVLLEHYCRQPGGPWVLASYRSPDEIADLATVAIRLPLAKLYRKVDFLPN